MKFAMKTLVVTFALIAVIILGTVENTQASMEDPERNILMFVVPYVREIDNEMELARILFNPQRTYHQKRNSEIINSLLGMPKNMNNAGKK